MTRTVLNQKPPIGAKSRHRRSSWKKSSVSPWSRKKKPQVKVRCTSDKTLPGQYYDEETNLHYNLFRYYDPQLGRYITSDPARLQAGPNTYAYVNANPISFKDPFGLEAVSASWIKPPVFNIGNWGVDNWEFVDPSWSWWGYVKFIRLYGHISGYINIDVKCEEKCGDREIHNRIDVFASGNADVGPNLYAFGIGTALGSVFVGAATQVFIGGAALLDLELQLLNAADEKAGPIILGLNKAGPLAICLGTQ